MKDTLYIFRRDLMRLLRSPAAVLVLIGVTILPSLYAWFNIAANMDPYANTSGIRIAVTDLDLGASSRGLSINAGREITANLRKDDQLGWEFVDKEAALEGVKSGKYYAAILIPEDFSQSLLSILSGDIQEPELQCFINEKANAVAPKIAGTGAAAIQSQINSTFSSVAAESVSGLLKESVKELSGDVTAVNTDLSKALSEAQKNISQYQQLIQNFQERGKEAAPLIREASGLSDSLKKAALDTSSALESTGSALAGTRKAAGNFSSAFSRSLTDGELLLTDLNSSLSSSLAGLEAKTLQVNGSVEGVLVKAQDIVSLNGGIIEDLQELIDQAGGGASPEQLNDLLSRLRAQNQDTQELLDSLEAGNSAVRSSVSASAQAREKLGDAASEQLSDLEDLRAVLDQSILPNLQSTLDTFASLSGQLSGILSGVPASSAQVNAILSSLRSGLQDTADALDGARDSLASVSSLLTSVQEDLSALASSDLFSRLFLLEGLDSGSIAAFAASPVEIRQEILYPVENYGSAMAPFYTNLAIWVGGIILIAILKTEVDRDENLQHAGAASLYFGRSLLYLLIGVTQGLIAALGDLFLPGMQCLHPAAFLLTGAVCSFVYIHIIYALSLTFRHIGKALCVLLVILQIPGSSGTYPVEMTPEFFQRLHPLLPFTYGVGAMRECIAGMYGTTFWRDLAVLLAFLPLALLIGLALRPRLAGLNHLFDLRLLETGFMVCEDTPADIGSRAGFSLLLRASLCSRELQIDTARRAQRFEKNYRRMIRAGFLAMLILPLALLILMFRLKAKMLLLTFFILSLIAISTWLILVEFIHVRLQEQQELAGMSFEEMLEHFRRKEELQ